jgi:hypothetical protein
MEAISSVTQERQQQQQAVIIDNKGIIILLIIIHNLEEIQCRIDIQLQQQRQGIQQKGDLDKGEHSKR